MNTWHTAWLFFVSQMIMLAKVLRTAIGSFITLVFSIRSVKVGS